MEAKIGREFVKSEGWKKKKEGRGKTVFRPFKYC